MIKFYKVNILVIDGVILLKVCSTKFHISQGKSWQSETCFLSMEYEVNEVDLTLCACSRTGPKCEGLN